MQYSEYRGGGRERPRAELLRGLGAAVRARRADLGLTMRSLAKLAGVSERFLAQLESGEGNISVARLEDVAEALGTTGAELLAAASVRRVDERPVLALVGLRGAGKSSVGAALADKLGVPFVELDELIVREAQMTLSTIFDRNEPMVVATGGSLVTDAETWGLLRSRAHTFWLKAPPEEHWRRVVAQGDVRPMRDRPRAMNELRALLAARGPLYEQADAVVDTSRLSVEKVARHVLEVARA
jgi:XRE family aerobic/anaerobic benzoate catabolism transcriptional regulator